MRYLDDPPDLSELPPEPHRVTPPTPWLPFSATPPSSGRVLVFTKIGLRTMRERLELSAYDIELGAEHQCSIIATRVCSWLVGVDPDMLRVRFNPNVARGAVHLGEEEVARFMVYEQGRCPRARARTRFRGRVYAGIFSVGLGTLGYWAGGPVAAALLGVGFLAFALCSARHARHVPSRF